MAPRTKRRYPLSPGRGCMPSRRTGTERAEPQKGALPDVVHDLVDSRVLRWRSGCGRRERTPNSGGLSDFSASDLAENRSTGGGDSSATRLTIFGGGCSLLVDLMIVARSSGSACDPPRRAGSTLRYGFEEYRLNEHTATFSLWMPANWCGGRGPGSRIKRRN